MNETRIVIRGENMAKAAFDELHNQAARAERDVRNITGATDELDTVGSSATSSLGALGSGFELIGATGIQENLERAALATDFLSGAGEGATLVMGKLKDGLGNVKSGLGNFSTNLRDASSDTGKFVRGVGAGVVAVGLLVAATQALSASFGSDLNPQAKALNASLLDFARTGKEGGEAARLLGDNFENLSYNLGTIDSGFWTDLGNGIAGFVENTTGLGEVFDQSLEHATQFFEGTDEGLKQLVEGGRADQAAEIFNKLAEEGAKQGVSVNELKKALPGYTAALEDSTAANERGADAVQKLADALNSQLDPLFAVLDAQDAVNKAQDEYNEAVKEFGKTSPEARSALRNLGVAAGQLASKSGEAGDAIGDLSPAMRATLKAAGLTEGQINSLKREMQRAKSAADALKGTYTVTLRTKYTTIGTPENSAYNKNNMPSGLAHGGIKGAANGATSSGLTWLGERGPELVDLPPGSMVHTAGDSARMAGSGGGGVVVAKFAPSGNVVMDQLGEWLLQHLQFVNRTQFGGDSQFMFGGGN